MTRRSRKATDRKAAVAYLRVSTDRERQALGEAAQRAAIEAWASRTGTAVVAWHVEEVSGGAPLPRRPVLLAALADVAARRVGALVVAKFDRFSRDSTSAALAQIELARAGAELAVAEGAGEDAADPTTRLLRGVLLAVGEFERAMIAARIKAALAVKQARGEMTGAPRYGWRLGADGVHVEPDPAERAVLARIASLAAEGASGRAIVATLAAEGVTGRAGRPLVHAAVVNALRGLREAAAAE